MRCFASALLLFAIAAHAQQGPPPGYPKDAPWPPPPPPCGEKGVPANAVCDDHGKLRNTQSPVFTPHQDLSEEQKAVLNGTAPQPKNPEIPKSQPPPPPPVTKSEVPAINVPPPTANTPPAVYTPPTNSDAESRRIQEQRQRQYQAGYSAGQGIGNLANVAILKHRINKACFDKHAYSWRFPNGATIRCSDWMAAHPRRTKKSRG
jgi:hypothetical protein